MTETYQEKYERERVEAFRAPETRLAEFVSGKEDVGYCPLSGDGGYIDLGGAEAAALHAAAVAYPLALQLADYAQRMRDECQPLYADGRIDAITYVALGNAIALFNAHRSEGYAWPASLWPEES